MADQLANLGWGAVILLGVGALVWLLYQFILHGHDVEVAKAEAETTRLAEVIAASHAEIARLNQANGENRRRIRDIEAEIAAKEAELETALAAEGYDAREVARLFRRLRP